METTTPFDLNLAIQRWRENLAQSPTLRDENLKELDSHLRDSIATLQTRGLSAEEAFMVAEKRVGKGSSLEREFAKVNRQSVWLDRALWMLIGIQVWGLALNITGSTARNMLSLAWRNSNHAYSLGEMIVPITVFALAQIAAVAASVALCWWVIIRKGQKIGVWLGTLVRRRSTLVATCVTLCLLSLAAYVFSVGLQVLVVKYVSPAAIGRTALYSSYSQAIVLPIQITAMLAFTLVLARKRLRASQA